MSATDWDKYYCIDCIERNTQLLTNPTSENEFRADQSKLSADKFSSSDIPFYQTNLYASCC